MVRLVRLPPPPQKSSLKPKPKPKPKAKPKPNPELDQANDGLSKLIRAKEVALTRKSNALREEQSQLQRIRYVEKKLSYLSVEGRDESSSKRERREQLFSKYRTELANLVGASDCAGEK